MPKFLGKLYPVYPHSKLEVFCIDALEENVFNVKDYVDCYQRAKSLGSFRGDIVYYNNSTWYMGESENVYEFVIDMRRALSETRKEQDMKIKFEVDTDDTISMANIADAIIDRIIRLTESQNPNMDAERLYDIATYNLTCLADTLNDECIRRRNTSYRIRNNG